MQRVHIAAGDALQGQQNMRGGDVGINRAVRHRAVTALASYFDFHEVRRRHKAALANGETARSTAGHIVQTVDFIDVIALHHALIDHDLAAAPALFGGLKKQHGSAIEIARFHQIFRRAEQHGCMPVMAASVHRPRMGGFIINVRNFMDRQRIHVGAQANDAAGCVGLAFDHRDHTGLCNAGFKRIHANLAQALLNEGRRLGQVEIQFWNGVQMSAPSRDFAMQIGKSVVNRHGFLPRCSPRSVAHLRAPRKRGDAASQIGAKHQLATIAKTAEAKAA